MNWFQWLGWALLPVALLVGWLTPGVWRRLKERAQIIQKLKEIQMDMTALEQKIPAEIKAEWAKLVAKVEKLLP